jgi:hypothetical protein
MPGLVRRLPPIRARRSAGPAAGICAAFEIILVLANRTTVLGIAANGRVFRVFATITVIVVAIIAAGALITEASGLF